MADPMTQQDMLQPFMEPYVRLAQRNVQLMTQFSSSPEMVGLWMSNAQRMFEQATRNATTGQTGGDPQKMAEQVQNNMMQVGQSKAFAELIQGFMQNYTQFMFELAQTGMTVFGQEQGKLMGQMQEATNSTAAEVPTEAKRPQRRS